jgi:lipopolysaccharide heptosyltransferase II
MRTSPLKSVEPQSIRRILIRGTNWVGDAVMSIPAMRQVRRHFPGADISLLVRPWVRDVYSAVNFVDRILDFDKDGEHRGWSGRARLVRDLRAMKFDLALLLQNAFEAAFLAWAARIPVRIGYARDFRSLMLTHPCRIDPEIRKVHQVYYYLGILPAAGLLESEARDVQGREVDIRIGVRPSDAERSRVLLVSSGIRDDDLLVGVNPGAHFGSAKRWLPDRYARVGDALAGRYGARIMLFGSKGERTFAEAIAGQMKHPALVLAGRTTLGELMALIRRCTLFITNDSGPMHLAAALDVPQLAIFGSTSEVATGPLSDRAEVLKESVACSPCFRRECPIDLRCMTAITVERVVSAAERRLDDLLKDGV